MGKKALDLTGQKFNRLTAICIKEKPKDCNQTGLYWLFRCECGVEIIRRGVTVKGGWTKSCGCLKVESSSKEMAKMQLKKHGTIEDRFLSRFTKVVSECWFWLAQKDKDGYGILSGNNSNTRAHRYSFEKYNGKILSGNVIRHTCDNPSCVNPKHLLQGTTKQNCEDMLERKRDCMIGSRNNKAKLTENDIPKIRADSGTINSIAEKFNVSCSTIKRIKSRKQWRHVK